MERAVNAQSNEYIGKIAGMMIEKKFACLNTFALKLILLEPVYCKEKN